MKYFRYSLSRLLPISLLLLSTSSFALSEKAQEGKELYLDANCKQCHGNEKNFDVKNHKAKDMDGIHRWVRNCDSALDIGWFPEEQENVAEYLNEAHYKYKKVK